MEELINLEERLQRLEYRIGIIEKFLDTNQMINIYKGEVSDLSSIRIEVLNDMKKNVENLKVKFDKNQRRNFYKE